MNDKIPTIKGVGGVHVLPRDEEAEKEGLRLAKAIWGDTAVVVRTMYNGRITAEARSSLMQPELMVHGETSALAARRLVRALRTYSVLAETNQ